MILAATTSQSGWSPDHLPFNWFDVALVLVLAFGLFRGRKNGMSKEVLPVIEWTVVMLAAGLTCPLLTDLLVSFAGLKKVTSTFILAYVSVAALILILFSFIKHSLREKSGGSNFFGSGEYYLGMISGTFRYACILIIFLAVLNAPIYTAADIAAQEAYNNRWFGGGEKGFSGDYIPSIANIQEAVFRKSLLGPYIHDYLAVVLINTHGPGGAPAAKAPVIHMGN